MKWLMSVVTLGVAGTFLVAQDEPPGGAVEGTVTNSATAVGVDGASVVFFGNQSNHYDSRTDAVGHFKITGMVPGNYRANAAKEGFATLLDGFASSLSRQGYSVASSPDPVRVDLKLTPLGTLSGRVFGPDGKPAAGVEVSTASNITGGMSITDAEGRFALENIRPGSYTLVARPPKGSEPEESKDGTRTAVVTTYYPSVADQSQAQQIAFSGQGDFYDIRMQTVPVHRVRGIVLDQEGKPLPGAELALLPNREDERGVGQAQAGPPGGPVFLTMGLRLGSGVPDAKVTAGQDGRFEFPAVPSGDWKIDAVSKPSFDPQAPRGTAAAMVGSDDVDDLQIRVAAPFKLIGTVEWKRDDPGTQPVSDTPRPFPPLTLAKADSIELFRQSGFVGSGGLSFDYITPGRYKAIVQPGFAAQIFLGDYEVTGQTFALAPGGPRLRVVLKTWSGTVRGTVENGEDATVVLIPQRNDDVYIGQMIRCGAGGTFELSKVSPGDYYIAAFDRVDGLLPSAAIFDLMPSRGTSVRVEEGSTADVMLSLVVRP